MRWASSLFFLLIPLAALAQEIDPRLVSSSITGNFDDDDALERVLLVETILDSGIIEYDIHIFDHIDGTEYAQNAYFSDVYPNVDWREITGSLGAGSRGSFSIVFSTPGSFNDAPVESIQFAYYKTQFEIVGYTYSHRPEDAIESRCSLGFVENFLLVFNGDVAETYQPNAGAWADSDWDRHSLHAICAQYFD